MVPQNSRSCGAECSTGDKMLTGDRRRHYPASWSKRSRRHAIRRGGTMSKAASARIAWTLRSADWSRWSTNACAVSRRVPTSSPRRLAQARTAARRAEEDRDGSRRAVSNGRWNISARCSRPISSKALTSSLLERQNDPSTPQGAINRSSGHAAGVDSTSPTAPMSLPVAKARKSASTNSPPMSMKRSASCASSCRRARPR